jgi:hypothetical protein
MTPTGEQRIEGKLDRLLESVAVLKTTLAHLSTTGLDHERRLRAIESSTIRKGLFSWNDVIKIATALGSVSGVLALIHFQ